VQIAVIVVGVVLMGASLRMWSKQNEHDGAKEAGLGLLLIIGFALVVLGAIGLVF
jgi:hypothetical protein